LDFGFLGEPVFLGGVTLGGVTFFEVFEDILGGLED